MKIINRSITFALLIAVLLAGCSAPAQVFKSAVASVDTAVQPVSQVLAAPQAAKPAAIAQQVASSDALAAYQGTLEQIYTQVNPSVVNIDVVIGSTGANSSQSGRNLPFGFGGQVPQQSQEALGSGFVWDTQGHIVTNNHVVDGATQVRVTFSDGQTVDAKVVGTDPNADLAVIKVDVPASKLQPVTLADSTQVKVGQLAIAIGNPFGLAGTMTTGIISAKERSLPVGLDNPNSPNTGRYSIPDIIQTDASINPGNSGGVLVDDQGHLIGVTAAIESSTQSNSGIGFVIPSAIVNKVVPELISSGHYDHPWLGVSTTPLTLDAARAMNLDEGQLGLLVVDVVSGGPAQKAGLRGSTQTQQVNGSQEPVGGDVIIAIDNQPVKRFEDLGTYLFEQTKVGQTVTLTILRSGRQQTLQVKLGVMPAQNQQ